jgi:hypothetical protein
LRVWNEDEIREMWPQAAGELEGFRRHLEAKSGLTAAQLGMALQLAAAEFKIMNASVDDVALVLIANRGFERIEIDSPAYRSLIATLKVAYRAGVRDTQGKISALAEYKRKVDLAWTAAMLAMSHELGGPKLTAEDAIEMLRAEMRHAEMEYQNTTRRKT